jgi:hypothetical protein
VDGAGKKLRTINGVIGANDVHDEVVTIADPTDMTQMLAVNAAGEINTQTNITNTSLQVNFLDATTNAILDAPAETLTIDVGSLGSVGIQVIDSGGAWIGALYFEGTIDNTNWVTIRAVQYGGILSSGTSVNGIFVAQVGGLLKFRVRCFAIVGACQVFLEATAATNAVTIANSLPTGTNTIGAVTTARTSLTAAAPTAVSVGVASTVIIASNANRKSLVLVNTSTAYISLNCVGAAAVLYSGITLNPLGGVWVMDEYTFTTAEIRGIASIAASNIAVQEYT